MMLLESMIVRASSSSMDITPGKPDDPDHQRRTAFGRQSISTPQQVTLNGSHPMSSAYSRDEIEAFVLEVAHRHGVERPSLDDRLTSLGIDSLTLAEQIGDFERRFHLKVDADIADVDTLGELVDYLHARS